MTAPAEAGLLDRDAAHLWHPYGAAGARQLYAVRGARGVHLDLEGPGGERHRAIDAMASWWSVVHGHGHPALVEALTRQAAAFPHVMFGGLTHAPAVDLAERLVAHTPAALEHVFLADSGSVSVEVALKLALQYQATRGRPSRRRFLTVRGGYHGDTAAPMGVCDPVDGMHAAFTSLVARHLFLPRPPAARWVPEGVAAAPMAPDAAPAGHWEADDAALAAWEDEDFCREKLGLDAPLGSIDRDKLNVNGSSLAAGHPFAATGGRILASLSKMLHEKGTGSRGLISICAAGGQGVVAIVEGA